MKIQKILSRHRNDYQAIYICEHCGQTEQSYGYADYNFDENVIPNMTCKSCKKKRGDLMETLHSLMILLKENEEQFWREVADSPPFKLIFQAGENPKGDLSYVWGWDETHILHGEDNEITISTREEFKKLQEIEVFVVIDTELGWDSVVGLYDNEEAAEKCAKDRGGGTSFVACSRTLESEFEES